MTRYKAIVEYDGSSYSGWQRQDEQASVQEAIEIALHKFCQEDVTVFASGRTDTGVHATGQVIHFDLEKPREPNRIYMAVNHHLINTGVGILNCEEVDSEFHARFSAIQREYEYHILNRHAPAPLREGRVWQVRKQLDVDAMNKAAQLLVGSHDFSSFRASECQAKSPLKTIDSISFETYDDMVIMHIKAKSFLHHMVRNIIGSLKLVGSGKWTSDDLQNALDAKDRTKAGPTAPAEGLYFTKVIY